MRGAREFAHIFYTDKIRQDLSCIHLVDYYLKMAVEAGVQKGKPEFKLPEDTGVIAGVNGKYAIFVPGAAQPNKRWAIEKFAELADKISSRFGLSIVATGSQGEREYIEAIGKQVINLAGKTSVRKLIPLMRGASLVVSNDTGPGHIAAAMGVPMVMIFGPTNPARVCPYGRPECIAAIQPNERGMKADSYDPKHDIRNITVKQVFEKVCGQLAER